MKAKDVVPSDLRNRLLLYVADQRVIEMPIRFLFIRCTCSISCLQQFQVGARWLSNDFLWKNNVSTLFSVSLKFFVCYFPKLIRTRISQEAADKYTATDR